MDCFDSEKSLVTIVELGLEPGEDHLAEELVNEAVFEGKMLTTNKAAAGRLRKSKDYYEFMKNVVKAPDAVLDVYREGYRPPWNKKPPSCHFVENNGSAKKNANFLWEEVKRLVNLDCIEETEKPSEIMHPWSVVFSKKMRALLDASRNANPYIKHIKTKFSDLSAVSQIIRKDWWYSVDDLESGYWQVPLAEDQYHLFGCSAIDPATGRKHHFRWKVLFLGINDAA